MEEVRECRRKGGSKGKTRWEGGGKIGWKGIRQGGIRG